LVIEEEKERLKEALSRLDLLVVQDYKLTETVRLAHVILPGVSAYEKEGTFTNDRGRVQRVKKTIDPPGTAKPDWEILTFLGSKLQAQSFNYNDPSEIMLDIARNVSAYKGINYDNIGTLGVSTSS
jgi:predicted molibdopterin-dependent oxidoreductase YjgC